MALRNVGDLRNPQADQTTTCAAEGCTNPGTPRVFPHYTITLCVTDFVRAYLEHDRQGVA